MKTYMAKPQEVDQKWLVVDAEGKILGRLASRVASVLRGKHKAIFTPHVDCGDGVIIVNAAKIRVSGKKLTDKIYTHYSGYPGGLREERLGTWLKRDPANVLRRVVKGMLPKGRLGDDLIGKLKIYPGADHPHSAQQPLVMMSKN